VLEVCSAISSIENAEGKKTLDRIVAMLTRLGQRGYSVDDQSTDYSIGQAYSDTDLPVK
jgi:hypothetical protein